MWLKTRLVVLGRTSHLFPVLLFGGSVCSFLVELPPVTIRPVQPLRILAFLREARRDASFYAGGWFQRLPIAFRIVRHAARVLSVGRNGAPYVAVSADAVVWRRLCTVQLRLLMTSYAAVM